MYTVQTSQRVLLIRLLEIAQKQIDLCPSLSYSDNCSSYCHHDVGWQGKANTQQHVDLQTFPVAQKARMLHRLVSGTSAMNEDIFHCNSRFYNL